jgi:two-component system sensor histidine kinase HydH
VWWGAVVRVGVAVAWVVLVFVLGLVCGALAVVWLLRFRPARRQAGESRQLRVEAAEAAERLAELSTLTGGLAHEIRNPLSTLKVNLQLLAEDWRDAADAEQSDLCRRSLMRLDTLRTEADRLQGILDDFLRYIGHQELQRTRADLNEVVEEMLIFFGPQATAHKLQIRSALRGEPLLCDIDVPMIKQALLNLFVNAQQAMPEGGELMVRTSLDVQGRACVEVIDTGSGIPPEIQDKVFQAYFSTKREGTGLGLPTTRRIVRAHGGTMDLHSEPGRGSCFTIRLPVVSYGGDPGVCEDRQFPAMHDVDLHPPRSLQ